jgi:hypothetical protein
MPGAVGRIVSERARSHTLQDVPCWATLRFALSLGALPGPDSSDDIIRLVSARAVSQAAGSSEPAFASGAWAPDSLETRWYF